MALSENPNLALIPSGYKSGKIYSVLPTSGVGDFDFSRSGTATRINSQGLIETVADGVPRLNYPLIDGKVVGCPSHLLEPSSTNLITYSNDFLDSSWNVFRGSVTADVIISPDGTQNASRYEEDSQIGDHLFRRQSLSITNGLSYTGSIFIKKGELTSIILQTNSSSRWVASATFDVENGVVTSGTGEIEDYGNGWYRCSISGNAVQTTTAAGLEMYTSTGAGRDGVGLYMYGAMFEQGSFATSYIPSLIGSQTTRSAETANNSGDASTFNDSEGVLMAEISALHSSNIFDFGLYGNTSTNQLRIGFFNNDVYASLYNGSYQTQMSAPNDLSDFTKIAFKFKENDFSLYINGIEVANDTSGTTFNSGDLVKLNLSAQNGTSSLVLGNIKQIQYYDSALTDSDLEKLTSWVSFSDMAEGQLYTIE